MLWLPRPKLKTGSYRVGLPSPKISFTIVEGFFPQFTSMFTVGPPSHVASISAAIIIPMCDRSEIRFGRGPGARGPFGPRHRAGVFRYRECNSAAMHERLENN